MCTRSDYMLIDRFENIECLFVCFVARIDLDPSPGSELLGYTQEFQRHINTKKLHVRLATKKQGWVAAFYLSTVVGFRQTLLRPRSKELWTRAIVLRVLLQLKLCILLGNLNSFMCPQLYLAIFLSSQSATLGCILRQQLHIVHGCTEQFTWASSSWMKITMMQYIIREA